MQTRYLRALIVVFFVTGITSVTFFVSNRLSSSQNVAPNAPESKPFALQRARIPDEDINPPTNQSPVVKPKKTAKTTDYLEEEELEFIRRLNSNNNSSNPVSTPKPSQSPQSPSGNNSNNGSGSPATTTIPTPKPDTFGAQGSSDDPNSYKSKDKNPCEDGLGFVSGTGCFKNQETGKYERRVLSLPETQRAYQQVIENVKDNIAQKSDAEILQIAAQNGKTCPPNDYICQESFITETTNKLLIDSGVVIAKDIKEIASARTKNQAIKDAFTLTDKEISDKYKTNRLTLLNNNNVENSTSLANAGELLSAYTKPDVTISTLVKIACSNSDDPNCINDMRAKSREQILKTSLGNSIPTEYIDQTINQYKNTEKSNKYISLFLDQTKTDKQKIEEYCKDFSIDKYTCLKNIEINDLATYAADPKALIDLKKDYSTQRIISDPKNDLNDLAKIYCGGKTTGCTPEKILGQIKNEEIKQSTNDQLLSKLYSDVANGTTDLAKIYCETLSNPGPKCRDEYNQNAFLSLIKNPEVKQQAINNRNQQLFQYIIPVKTNQTASGIDVETKKEVEKFDADFQHAYWAYWKEKTSGKTASQVNNDKLGEDFYKLFAANPSEFNKYLSQYNANPILFTDLQTATAFKAATDINSSIIALSNQAVKSSPIKGLFDGNKVVSWNGASEEYKQEARELACANDKSIAIYCSAIDGYASRRITEEQRKNALTQIDATIANNNKQATYLQEVYDNKITNNLPSSFYSNTVAIDNFTISQDVREKAIQQAKKEVANQLANQATSNPRAIASQQYQIQNLSNTDFLNKNLPVKNININTLDLVSQKLDQMLVTETYTRGGGLGGSLAAAALATTACSALGPGAAACGAVGGLAGAISTYIPILGTVTAEEMALEQQAIKDFRPVDILENDFVNGALSLPFNLVGQLEKKLLQEYGDKQIFNNDSVSSTIQSLYSSQGAYCDTADGISIGGSCTRKDNQYANYQSMLNTYGQFGANLNSLSDQNFVGQLAIQGTINQQFDALQRENQRQAIANIIVAPIIGAASGGIGGKLAQSSAAINNPSYTQALLRQQAVDWALWAPGSAIGVVQNASQFNATAGFIDTQKEIDLEICIREKGASNCKTQQQAVDEETANTRTTAIIQGFLTDTALQVGQSGFSFATQYAQIASQNPNQTRPTNANDSTFISPQLAELLNAGDPRILNSNATNADTITLNNLIKSQTLVENSRSLTLEQFKNQNLNTSVADESILQGVVLYKDLPDSQFTAKLKEIGFTQADIDVAQKIRESGADILYTNAINERVEQNEAIAGQLRNNPRDQSENLNIKVDQEIMSDYNNFRKQQAEKFVADAKKALETENDQPTATLIDTKKEALKGFLAEAGSTDRIVPMNPTDITNHLTELGYSPEDIQYVISRSSLPEVKAAIDRVLDFNNRSAQIRKEVVNIDTSIQDDINNRIINQRVDLLNDLANSVPDANSSNNISTTTNRVTFKPEDDIKQTMPGNEKNTIGKIPSKTIEIKGQQEQVYYRISYLENGKVTATEIHPLTNTNTLPTDKPFLLEFGIKKDPSSNIGDDNFIAINDDNINPSRGTQKLAMNISNEYTFGDQDVVSNAPAQPNTPPRPALTDAQRNQYAAMYLNERNKYRDSGMSNAEYRNTVDQLNNDYRQLGIDIENDLPNGYGPIRSALVSFWNRLFDPGTPEEPYNRFFFQRQQQNTSQDTNTPPSPPIKVLERTPLPKVDLDNAISKIDQPPLSSEQTARRLAALKDATSKYTVSDDNLPQFLKNLGYSDDEINYALRTRQHQEIQEIIRELKLHDTRAEEDMNNALKQILDQGPLFADEVKLLEQNLNSQRQSLLDNQFEKANGAIANIQDETLNRIDSNLPEVFPTQITEPLPNTTQSIPQSTANSIRNSINMIIDKIKKQLRKINEVGGIRTSGVKSGANTNTVTGPMGITLLVPKKNGPLDTAKLVPLLREHIPLIEENKMIDLARALTQRGVTESELDTLMTTARYLHTSGSTRLFLGISNHNIVESLTPDIKLLTINTGISEEQLKFVLREYLNNPNRDSTIISLIRSDAKEKVSRATYLSNTEITAILKMIESGQLDKILQTATDIQTKLGLNQKPIPMPTTYQTDDTPNAIPTTMPNDSPDIFALTQYAIELATSPTPKNPTDFLLEQNMSPEIIDNHLRLVSSTDFSEIVTLARQIADSNADRIVSQSQFLNDMRNSTTDDVLATFAQELHGELLNEVATRINDIASKYFDTSNIVTSNGVAHRPQDLLRAAATIKKTSPNQQPPMNLSLYTTQEIDIIFRLVASEEKTVIETLNNVDTDTSPITTSDAQSTIKKAVDSTTFIPKIDNEENSSPQATTALTKKRTIFSRLKSITYPISDVIAKIRAKLKPNQSQTTTSASRLGIFDPISPKIDATYRQNVLNSQLPDLTTPPNRNYNTNNSQAPDIVSNISENIKGTIDKGRATKYWGIDTHDNRSGKVYTNSEALDRVTILGENLSALKFLEEQAVSLSSTDQKIYGKESTTNREILINELILTKENTIAKRLGIPLENIHFLSNEDLALVMTSFHRLVDGQLELVSVDQNGNITYRNKSTKESFVLGPEWPDTRIINKIFAKQQYSALADQDVTKLYYKYLQDSQYNISVIEDKIITPVSGTKRLNYNNEKYFDINTGKYTNTESPYTRIVLDDLGNISENIYFESPMILSNKRSSSFSELNLATKNKSSNRTYSKDDLIELINQRVITLDEANKYATAINKPQITATDLAPQDIFPSTMPTEDSPDTPNPPTTSLTNHQKELFLIENGFKQNLTEMTIRPLLESYQRWKNLGYSDQDIMVDFPKMVAVHNPKYVLENAFHVTKDTTYSEYLAQFNDLAEYTIVTDLWIYGHVDVENNPIPGIIELVSKQTPASVIQKYFNFKNEPPTTADAFVEFAYNPKRLLDEKEYQKNYSEYVEHTRTLSKGDPEYSDDFDELWVLAHINGEKTPATGVDVLRLKGTPETTISKYIDPNNPQKKPLIIDKTASLESIYPPIAKSLKENTKENNILNRNSTKAIRKILLHKTETNATIREKIRYAIQKSGISEFISEKTFPLSVRLETFELYLGDFIDQNLSRKQILEIDMAIRLAKLYTNESTSEIVSRLPERYQKTIQKLQTALDKYKAAWNEDDYGSLPFKLQSRSEKWQTIKNRTIISTIMTTGSYLISTLSEGNDKNSENYESLNYLLPESLSSPAPTPTPTTINNQQNTLPTPTQTPTQTAQLPPITLNRPNQEASSLNVAIDRCMDIVGVETNGNGDLRENYGQQMATCFCTNAEGGCNEGNANQQISEILLNIYNRNLLYGYTDQAFYPILEILYNVSLSSPNVCNQNRICDTNNTEKFATCQVGKASDIYPTDIIFDNDNNPHICPQSWSANNDTVSCNASFTTTGISDNTQTIEVKNIKKIWRTDSHKTSSCWQ